MSVTAGMPRATNGPCSPKVNGKPRSSSWRSAGRTLGARDRPARAPEPPQCARAQPPANGPCLRRSSSLGGPTPAIASRLITARASLSVGRVAQRTAPRRGRRTRRRRWRRRRACGTDASGGVVPATGAYARASSISAAVPEALSLAPGPSPLLSRCAVITIARGEVAWYAARRCLGARRGPVRDVAPEAVRLPREVVEGQLFRRPTSAAPRAAGRSGRSIRVVPSELPCELLGGRSVERGRQRRRRQRLGPADGEGREKQRQSDEEPRSAHQAGVDRPLDRAAAWARVRRARSSGRRHGTNQCRERRGGLNT